MKRNKLKIGDEVQIKRKLIKEHREHLIDWFCIPISHELKESSLKEVHFWLSAYLSGDKPKGNVIGYGSQQDPDDPKSPYMIGVAVKHMGDEIIFYEREGSLKKC